MSCYDMQCRRGKCPQTCPDVTQGPASCMTSLQQEPPQCAGVGGQMEEKWSSVSIMKRWNGRLKGGEKSPVVSGQPRHLGSW